MHMIVLVEQATLIQRIRISAHEVGGYCFTNRSLAGSGPITA